MTDISFNCLYNHDNIILETGVKFNIHVVQYGYSFRFSFGVNAWVSIWQFPLLFKQ